MNDYYKFPPCCEARAFLVDEVIAAVEDARKGGGSLATFRTAQGQTCSELFVGEHGRVASVLAEPEVMLNEVERLVQRVLAVGGQYEHAAQTQDTVPCVGNIEELESLALQRSKPASAFFEALDLLITQILAAHEAGILGTEHTPRYGLTWQNTKFIVGGASTPTLEVNAPSRKLNDKRWAYPRVVVDLSEIAQLREDRAWTAAVAAISAVRRDSVFFGPQDRLAQKTAYQNHLASTRS